MAADNAHGPLIIWDRNRIRNALFAPETDVSVKKGSSSFLKKRNKKLLFFDEAAG
jgi:hypothetical protein